MVNIRLVAFPKKAKTNGECRVYVQEYMSLEAISDFLQSKSDALYETDFFRFSENRIKELKEIGRMGTVSPLQNAVNRFRDFPGKDVIEFEA
jgi:hypothetical protein